MRRSRRVLPVFCSAGSFTLIRPLSSWWEYSVKVTTRATSPSTGMAYTELANAGLRLTDNTNTPHKNAVASAVYRSHTSWRRGLGPVALRAFSTRPASSGGVGVWS